MLKILENNIDERRILHQEAADERKEFVHRVYNNPNYKKMKAICDKYGYELGIAYWTNYDEAYINIYPREGEYLPEVYPPQVWMSKKEPWKVMTTSYGSLSIDEFEKFINSNKRASEMIKELSQIDLTTLEHEPEYNR